MLFLKKSISFTKELSISHSNESNSTMIIELTIEY